MSEAPFAYAHTAASATRMLQRYGAPCTIKHTNPGVYDPSSGMAAVNVINAQSYCAVFAMPQRYINGTLVLQGDQQAYCAAGAVIRQGDTLNCRDSFTGEYRDFQVIDVKPVSPAGVPVLFVAHIRG